jgi:hypothetical protein
MTSEDAPPRSFKCPKLECGAEYFAFEQDVPPTEKPKCQECGTAFLAKAGKAFIYYFPVRDILH